MQHLSATAVTAACLTAACLTVLTPSTARALSCATNWVQAPEDGDIDVPTNTLLWGYNDFSVDTSSRISTRLIGPSGSVQLEQRYLAVHFDAIQKWHIPI